MKHTAKSIAEAIYSHNEKGHKTYLAANLVGTDGQFVTIQDKNHFIDPTTLTQGDVINFNVTDGATENGVGCVDEEETIWFVSRFSGRAYTVSVPASCVIAVVDKNGEGQTLFNVDISKEESLTKVVPLPVLKIVADVLGKYDEPVFIKLLHSGGKFPAKWNIVSSGDITETDSGFVMNTFDFGPLEFKATAGGNLTSPNVEGVFNIVDLTTNASTEGAIWAYAAQHGIIIGSKELHDAMYDAYGDGQDATKAVPKGQITKTAEIPESPPQEEHGIVSHGHSNVIAVNFGNRKRK